MKHKKLLYALIVVFVLVVAFLIVMSQIHSSDDLGYSSKTISLCFYGEQKTPQGLYNRAWVKINMKGSNATGEAGYLPAEKDSKTGIFAGSVNPVDKMSMSRTATVLWDSQAEGMHAAEELKIVFGEGSANLKFGEMMDNGDGLYVYKDPDNLTNSMTMSDITCDELDQKIGALEVR